MTGKFRVFWMVMMPFLLSSPEVYMYNLIFARSICLEVARDYLKENGCRIELGKVIQWFTVRSGISQCGAETFCNVYFKYWHPDRNTNFYHFKEVKVAIFSRTNWNFTTKTLKSKCKSRSTDKERTLYIDVFDSCQIDKDCDETEDCLMNNNSILDRVGECVCTNDTVRIDGICRKVDVELGESCSEDIQCSKAGYNRFCDNFTSTCSCIYGFTDIEGHCLKSGLEVKQSCLFNEQCNGTANSSVCRSNSCACMTEHYHVDGVCKPTLKELPVAVISKPKDQQQLQDKESMGSIAQVIAAVFGGFVSGILVCFVVVYVLKERNRTGKSNRNTDLKANNLSYEKDISTHPQKESRNIDMMESTKISHVRPIIKSDSEYSNAVQGKPDTDDVYNHLNEKRDNEADMSYYDHVQQISSGMVSEEEYTDMSRSVIQSRRLQCEIEPQDDYAVAKGSEESNVYSILRK